MASTTTVQIPQLGEVHGTYDANTKTSQFLGIPYAKVSKRWTRATPIESFLEGKHDGTTFGPICPQLYKEDSPSITQITVGGAGFPPNPVPTFDEFGCLNLNVLVPERSESEKLPVLIWIHGGAFSLGSNTELVYDGKALVESSIKSATPMIYVAINYRLGYFGFLSSEALLKENGGKAVGNYGLWDQRLALQFIKDNISAFGGDPERITIFGESAGSASVHSHLLSPEPLFQQAIMQSGTVRTIGPLKPQDPYMANIYSSLATTLGFPANSDPEALRALPATALIGAMAQLAGPTLPVSFITDDTDYEDGFYPKDTDWATPQPFCKRLIIGDCQVEGIIIAKNLGEIPEADVEILLSDPDSLDPTYLAKFGLGDLVKGQTIPVPLVHRLVGLATELTFFGPTQEVIEKADSATTYVYRLDRPNGWGPGPFAGVAHHTIDLLYLAGVPKKFPTSDADKDAKLSDAMVGQWVDFVVGKEPWRAAGKENWELVYGADGDVKETRRDEVTSRDFANIGKAIGGNAGKALKINAALSSGKVL